ncbi:hypothetical protein ACIRP7_36450 [Streptomyces sp. NPDC102270]|uniref:hypothetical protein n=1 Tax=Streptomyces sp. NPDC102270 TaxID=3366150 RepID=UPI0038091719
MTNAARYAEGATVRVRIEPTDDRVKPEQADSERLFTVTVTDDGGTVVEPGLGTGRGLARLAAAVTAAGGTFRAGPVAQGRREGWRVRASLPAAPVLPLRGWALWRGTAALDYALVALAIALSLGASLMTAKAPFGGLLPALVTVLLSGLHAVPLAWRSRAPGRALTAVLSALLLWWACDRAAGPGRR